jgi:diguanylate cyclase (GGDEF)-like protein
LLAFSNMVADVFLRKDAGAATRTCIDAAAAWFQLDEPAARGMIEQTRLKLADIDHLFTRRHRAVDLLSSAKQRLLELSLQTHEHAAELKKQKRLIQDQANHDQLTAAANRRSFTAALNRHFQNAVRAGKPMSLVALDCDHFKNVNDTYGHLSGDETLKMLTRVLIENTRRDAVVARVGGEEMAVILPGAGEEEAVAAAERLRETVEATTIRGVDGQSIRVTASFGVATYTPGGPLLVPYDLVQAADEAVYAAKRGGRNRVEVWQAAAVEQVEAEKPAGA